MEFVIRTNDGETKIRCHNCISKKTPKTHRYSLTPSAHRYSRSQNRTKNTLYQSARKRERGNCNATQKDSDGKIVESLWWMKKQGYRETTIISRGSRLRKLTNLNANLDNPESVKEVIAVQSWKDSRKETMVFAHDLFAKWRERS